MSYCFIFLNIYLKIFFMIKVYGCEKKMRKKKFLRWRDCYLKGFCKVKYININLFFFLFKKYFCFFKRKFDFDKYFFKFLFLLLLYDKKNICLGMLNFILNMVYMYL